MKNRLYEFYKMYEEVYQLCLNTEKVMSMFSKELQELDRNTVLYMIDEMQNTINAQGDTISEQESTINKQESTISKLGDTLTERENTIREMEQKYQEALEEIKKLKNNQ